jgi:hypothetical protein
MPHASEQSPSAFRIGVCVFHYNQPLESIIQSYAQNAALSPPKLTTLSYNQVRFFLKAVAAVDEADGSGFGTHDDGVGQSV